MWKKIFVIFCLAGPAFAASGETSGGGNGYCSEYISLMDTVSVALLQVEDQAQVKKIHPMLDAKALWELSSTVTCQPVLEFSAPPTDVPMTSAVPLHAISYRGGNPRTELKYLAWKDLAPHLQLELTVHELLVLAGIERSYFYKYTPKVVSLIAANSDELKAMHIAGFGSKIQVNPNSTTTIFKPSVDGLPVGQELSRTFKSMRMCSSNNSYCWFENQPDSWAAVNEGVADGFCISLGFKKAVEASTQENPSQTDYASYAKNGSFQGGKQKGKDSKLQQFESITCQ